MRLSNRLVALEAKGRARSTRWLRVIQHEDETQDEAISRAGHITESGVNFIVRQIVGPIAGELAHAPG